MRPLIINLYGSPSAGKSTIAAELFSRLKWQKKEVELVTEYAKDLTWEERYKTLENQIYVFAKQHHRIYKLMEKVDYIITDSPILLSILYGDMFYNDNMSDEFRNLILYEHNKMNTFDIYLNRTTVYNPNGRNQTEEEANMVGDKIINLLDTYTPYIKMDADVNTASNINTIINEMKVIDYNRIKL